MFTRRPLDKEGNVVETWRENYPYPQRMSREQYDCEKRPLQIELLKLQKWIKATGRRC
jgi:polyphosphate kinase